MWSFNGSKMKPSVCDAKRARRTKGKQTSGMKIVTTTQRTPCERTYDEYAHSHTCTMSTRRCFEFSLCLSIHINIRRSACGHETEKKICCSWSSGTHATKTTTTLPNVHVFVIHTTDRASFYSHRRLYRATDTITSLWSSLHIIIYVFVHILSVAAAAAAVVVAGTESSRYSQRDVGIHSTVLCAAWLCWLCMYSPLAWVLRVFESKSVGQNYLNASDVKRRVSSTTSSS